jgi:capsular polysaccharide biosynthesis protein/MinD-like ATPase involved in chromosome partitioning or flagellar assembly
MSHAPEGDDLQLADYAGVLRRRWWLIVVFAVVGILGSVGFYAKAHKVYVATASVYVTATSATANQVADGRTSGAVNLDTEAQVVQSATVAQAAAKLMHSPAPLQKLIDRVSVTVPANSQVLLISCEAGSADGSAICAQSFAQAYLTYTATSTTSAANSQISSLQSKISALEAASAKLSVEVGSLPSNSSQRATAQQQLTSDQSQLDSLNSQVAELTAELANPSGGSIISSATPPSSPSSPRKLLVFPSGLVAGLLIGLIAAFIWDRRDRRIRGPRDLTKINVPVVMSWPVKHSPIELAIAAPRSPLGRDFAGLARVLSGSLGSGSHVLLVTNAGPGHGASLVAANLAASLSRSQPDVTLVCADLENSVIPAMVGLPTGRGLTDLLATDSSAYEAGDRVAIAPQLRVIGPGSAALADAEELRQDAVDQLLADLRTDARWIVVESPSIVANVDAYTLAQAADAAILVVEVPTATSDQVLTSIEQLDRMSANVLGAAVLPALGAAMPRSAVVPAQTVPVGPPALPADTVPADTVPVDTVPVDTVPVVAAASPPAAPRPDQNGRNSQNGQNDQSNRKGQSSRNDQGTRKGQSTRNGQGTRTGQGTRNRRTTRAVPASQIQTEKADQVTGESDQVTREPTVIIDWSAEPAQEIPSSAPRG